jgi:hypothetical protein
VHLKINFIKNDGIHPLSTTQNEGFNIQFFYVGSEVFCPKSGASLKHRNLTPVPPLRSGLPFIPTLPGGAFWQIW